MRYDVGVQSVVYKGFAAEGMVDELGRTGIEHVELWDYHLSRDDGPDRRDEVLDLFEGAGIDLCGFGVLNIDDPGEIEPQIAFADSLGVDYVPVNYPPERDDITEALVEAGEAHDLPIHVHNYSTVHHDDMSAVFSSAEDVRRVLDEHPSPYLGACVDIGHFLVMGEGPDEVIPALGGDVGSIHLKDTSEDELEDAPGEGVLDIAECVDLLDEHASLDNPIVIEYELPEERATDALIATERRLRAALD